MITSLIVNKLAGLVARFNSQAIEDLYSVGLMALYRAAQKFDPAKNIDFGVVAYCYLKNTLLTAIEAETRHNDRIEFDSELFDLQAETCEENDHEGLYIDIQAALATMNDRDQSIFCDKIGMSAKPLVLRTQELAQMHHLTTQHVNRTFKKGLQQVQHLLSA